MRLSFANLQVRSRKKVSRRAVIDGLRQCLGELGWEETGEDRAATRRILVGPPVDRRWVPVFDSEINQSGVGAAGVMAAALSKQVTGECLVLAAHDGAVLEHALYYQGRKLETGSSWPGYSEGQPPPQQPTPDEGDAAAWAALLREGATAQQLTAAWRGTPGHAEQLVNRIAPLVGWQSAWVCHGYPDLPESLRRRCWQGAWRRKPAPRATEIADIPMLIQDASPTDNLDLRTGDELRLEFLANNLNCAPSSGINVVLFGSAVDDGMLSSAEVAVFIQGQPIHRDRCVARRSDTGTQWVVELEELFVPNGCANSATAERDIPGPIAAVNACDIAQLRITVVAQATRRGNGNLYVGLVPVQNLQPCQTSWAVNLRIAS